MKKKLVERGIHVFCAVLLGAVWASADTTPPSALGASISTGTPYDAAAFNITLCWQGFTDEEPGSSGIARIEERLLPEEADWRVAVGDCRQVTALLEGEYTLEVRAIDNAGNVSSPVARTFCIDRTPPQALLAEVRINGGRNCTDLADLDMSWGGFSDINRCPGARAIVRYELRYRFNGTEMPLASLGLPESVEEPSLRLADAVPGTHRLEVRAIDRAGNVSLPASTEVIVDRIAPVIQMAGYGMATAFGDKQTEIRLFALVDDPEAFQVRARYYDESGRPRFAPINLRDFGTQGDDLGDDGLYTATVETSPETPPGLVFLELITEDPCRNASAYWPFLRVLP